MNAAERLAFSRTLPPLDEAPAQFRALNVAGLRSIFALTSRDVDAVRSLADVRDPVHVLAIVAPHAIPRAESEHARHVEAARVRAAERARWESERAAFVHAGRTHESPALPARDDDEAPAARFKRGDAVRVGGLDGVVLYVVNGAAIAKLTDERIVSV